MAMKVFVHMPSDGEYMDGEVEVAVECSAAPRIGDVLHLAVEDSDVLEKAVMEGGKKLLRYYSGWVYFFVNKYYLMFDDCIFVTEALWRRSDSGEYQYHICLNSEKDAGTEPPRRDVGDSITDDILEQMLADYNRKKENDMKNGKIREELDLMRETKDLCDSLSANASERYNQIKAYGVACWKAGQAWAEEHGPTKNIK